MHPVIGVRRFIFVSERAKLRRLAVIAAAACIPAFAQGCTEPRPDASYDPVTRRLVRIDSDLNHDGTIDHRAYMDGNLPLRAEADENADGRIDRWEYFDGGARLTVVGGASRRDGIEDTWTWAAGEQGERRVDQSLVRDRGIDRREYYREAALVRAEADTNADGRIDRWETFESGSLLQVALDTTFAAERPNRRLTYTRDGQFRAVEIDRDGTGAWEPSR